jgi:FAD/FMN-containing dehydrogenase/Fe-S oxidoreductase
METRDLKAAEEAELVGRLRSAGVREVLGDTMSLGLYATDASMFQIWPRAVAVPRDRREALAAVRTAAEAGAAILPRGGGTSLSGQTINRAVVIDSSKYMNRLLELNVDERWVRVEPGLVRDELNAMLKPHGLHFAPDPATSSRANVGGMINNNAAGMRSIQYGMTIDHIEGVDLALATGEVLNLGPLDAEGWAAKCRLQDREGEIYRGFQRLIEENREEIVARYPKVRRRSGGYMLDAFAGLLRDGGPWNLAKIVAASEGSLGMVLEAKLRLEPLPKHRFLCAAHFNAMEETLAAVGPIVAHGPSAVELLDGMIVELARTSRNTRERCGFLRGEAVGGILVIEVQGDDAAQVEARLRAISADVTSRGLAYAAPVFVDAPSIADVWLMRENGLGLMTTVKGDRKPTPFIEDCAVPLEGLPEYIARVREICAKHGRRIGLFAHASVGLLHVRPLLDMHLPEEIDVFRAIQDEVFELVVQYGGSFSGEHGDGLVRGGYNERFFGPKLYGAFRELKRLFDPAGLMNPGHKVDTPPVHENREAFRYMPGYRNTLERTWFHYRADGGMRQAVEQCTGTGVCRRTGTGVMCPSYMATRDEEHSTRGRANALRLAMTGQLGADGMASERLQQALDLCLSCKACATECPNNVDMAKFKAEATQRFHERHGSSLRERMLRDLSRMAPLASGLFAPLVNGLLGWAPVRALLENVAGIDRRRRLPCYARRALTDWFVARGNRGSGTAGRVALFCDTYIEHYEPEVGKAAVEVLEAAGYAVELAVAGCCQRPAISKGFLDHARIHGSRTMAKLDAWAREGAPIVVCEPSCASALADDLPDLIDDAALGARVAACIKPVDQFLGEALLAGKLKLPWGPARSSTLLVHGHCHQKALFSLKPGLALLGAIPGARVESIQAGCCGMAGAFGYEKEHYDLSVKIAEDRLLPALNKAFAAGGEATTVVAGGFSCRHQVADLAGRAAIHPVQAVRAAMANAGHVESARQRE